MRNIIHLFRAFEKMKIKLGFFGTWVDLNPQTSQSGHFNK